MKSQDKSKKLDFGKRNIIELNNNSLSTVNGGGTTTISNITTIINFSKDTLCTSDVK